MSFSTKKQFSKRNSTMKLKNKPPTYTQPSRFVKTHKPLLQSFKMSSFKSNKSLSLSKKSLQSLKLKDDEMDKILHFFTDLNIMFRDIKQLINSNSPAIKNMIELFKQKNRECMDKIKKSENCTDIDRNYEVVLKNIEKILLDTKMMREQFFNIIESDKIKGEDK